MDNFQGAEPTQEEIELLAHGYSMRQAYWPNYTWHIQTMHLNNIDRYSQSLKGYGVDIEVFNKRKADLFDKINASFYHLRKLKENEELIINLGKKIAEKSQKHTPKGVIGILGTPYEPIDYEYEALLVTLKSALDILSMILANPARLNADNIVSLRNEGVQEKRPNDFLAKVNLLLGKEEHAKTIDEFRNIDGVSSKRNHAVHKGSLPTGTINIQYMADNPEIGILRTRTLDISTGATDHRIQQSLDEYVTNTFYAVCDLIIEALELLVQQELPKGKKMSVYEARIHNEN